MNILSTGLLMLTLLVCQLVRAGEPPVIPFGEKVTGTTDIAEAWYTQPTERYPHAVLGDDIEAGAVVVKTPAGEILTAELDVAVFEDNTPQLADIDNDGRDEVWVVRSNSVSGARLEAYAIHDGQLQIRYTAEPVGIDFRWLNPIGVADMDRDGRNEVAYIETPHIGGIITVLGPRGDKLEVVATERGYSTHAMGSPHLDLSTLADLDADGAADIILPVQSRRHIAVVSLRDGTLRERWRSPELPQVDPGLRVTGEAGVWQIRYETAAGDMIIVPLPLAKMSP